MAKSVVTFDCSGTSDSTRVPLNDGQGSARVDGLPVPAKLAQSVRMLTASACWSGVRVLVTGNGAFGWSKRYGSSVPCVDRPRCCLSGGRMFSGALSSLNW